MAAINGGTAGILTNPSATRPTPKSRRRSDDMNHAPFTVRKRMVMKSERSTSCVPVSFPVSEDFELYIMFRPKTPGAMWVPLRMMAWHWDFCAARPDNTMSVIDQNVTSEISSVVSIHPEWAFRRDSDSPPPYEKNGAT